MSNEKKNDRHALGEGRPSETEAMSKSEMRNKMHATYNTLGLIRSDVIGKLTPDTAALFEKSMLVLLQVVKALGDKPITKSVFRKDGAIIEWPTTIDEQWKAYK